MFWNGIEIFGLLIPLIKFIITKIAKPKRSENFGCVSYCAQNRKVDVGVTRINPKLLRKCSVLSILRTRGFFYIKILYIKT